jgi:hypothetical protein
MSSKIPELLAGINVVELKRKDVSAAGVDVVCVAKCALSAEEVRGWDLRSRPKAVDRALAGKGWNIDSGRQQCERSTLLDITAFGLDRFKSYQSLTLFDDCVALLGTK